MKWKGQRTPYSMSIFNKDVLEMSETYNICSWLPSDLKILILEYSGHLIRGSRSLCWFLYV